MGGKRRDSFEASTRAQPSEDQITAAVLQHWRMFGVEGSLVASIPNANAHGQAGLTKGLPDLLVFSPTLGRMTGFIEIKTARGRRSPAQRDIADLLLERLVPYACTYGRDEPIRILELWGAVRATRGVGDQGPADPHAVSAGVAEERERMAV
jgi:hypothetical protein